MVPAVEVIDPATLSGDHVMFGAHVHLIDEETEKKVNYQIVGVYEADIKHARLSISSRRFSPTVLELGLTVRIAWGFRISAPTCSAALHIWRAFIRNAGRNCVRSSIGFFGEVSPFAPRKSGLASRGGFNTSRIARLALSRSERRQSANLPLAEREGYIFQIRLQLLFTLPPRRAIFVVENCASAQLRLGVSQNVRKCPRQQKIVWPSNPDAERAARNNLQQFATENKRCYGDR